MSRIEPGLVPLVTDLERGLRQLGIQYGVVGALVPELLLEARPPRMTNDADVTVVLESLADFDALKDQLAGFGFSRTGLAHRMRHRSGGFTDILPFSSALAPDGRLRLEEGVVLNMAGFSQVVPHALVTGIDGGPTLPLAPLPLYALLKLVAFTDRKQPKDLAGVLHCLEHYLEDDERRYGVEHGDEGVPFEYGCAYLLGLDARRFLDEPLRQAVTIVLEMFDDPDAQVVGVVMAETGRLLADDERRADIFQLYRWFRLGLGL